MAEFLTTQGVSYNIENIIKEAKNKLILVSPYLQISKTFYERLKEASNKEVTITIIFGKDELKPNERNSLAELKNVKLFFFENLHAKCYFNENKMVITSMNMYEYSEKNNREMGVLIDRENDIDLFNNAVNETQSILQHAEQIPLRKATRQFQNDWNKSGHDSSIWTPKKQVRGYCIRCEERINFDAEKPFCPECYMVWNKFGNYEYEENVCHRCGEYEPVTMAKPLCYDCFNIERRK